VNVLIATDMEGIAGIDDYGDCLPSHPAAYARGRRLMTDEVLVAIEALREGGAGRISVGDWHMVGTNIERERMPVGIEVQPIAELALVEVEPSIAKAHGGPLDAVVLIGHHASTPNPRAFCSHTFVWEMEVQLDGESLSEVQVYAQALAAEGTPALVVAGDRWMLEELGEGEMGSARLVEAKQGEGRATACSRGIDTVRSELRGDRHRAGWTA
jgi:D-aminopeptidase